MNYKFLKDCDENEWVYCEYRKELMMISIF